MQQQNANTNTATMDGKSIAIISYLTIIGWIIAYVMHGSNKSQLGAFHLRQSLFLMLSGFAIAIAQWIFFLIPILGWIISILLYFVLLGLFVLWIIGLIAAINGEEKPVPVLVKKGQEILKGIQ
ncbi:DUF4870 domain-containing protein [Lacibacter sediminis]|uniref:DUF4870 domain-containing protein n=1 Tax=Lacibacter sediminis TaxID=2760713 RepID=A0A7G5XLN1_9BACT|nr:hypothetical protein [Lacibacter sediminis]QNA46384.1 hypothetical protein H4075_09495 [Lacibacter sediminis]